jgi:hypothetical protein
MASEAKPRKARSNARGRGAAKGDGKGSAGATKKDYDNEFEIMSDFSATIAELVAKEAARVSHIVARIKSPKPTYTVGNYMLDQMKNSTRLLEAYLESMKK